MDIVAAILLFTAFFVGVFPFTHLAMGHTPQPNLMKAHVALVLLGLIALIVYAFITPEGHKHYDTLALLLLALVVGGIGFTRRGHRGRLGWLLAYTVTGGFAVLWLLTFVVPNT